MKIVFVITSLFFLSIVSNAESGPDNGTDYVKILFADAQYSLNSSLVTVLNLGSLSLSESSRTWLNQFSEGATRFERLKYYLRKLDLRFQTEPCTDGSGRFASICYFRDPEPYVLISLKENKMTTKDQAMAMLVHEAGHLTGEADHLFLDKVGVELAANLIAPQLIIVDLQNTEIVSNIFNAKVECEAGISLQAQKLKKLAASEIEIQCAQRKSTCDLSKTNYIFQGEAIYVDGRGYTMEVKCSVRAVLVKR